MEYTTLGNTDIQISKLCVGCMSFTARRVMHDWTLDETESGQTREPYLPHRVVGGIDQNPADGSRKCSAVPISGFSVSGIPLGLIGSVF